MVRFVSVAVPIPQLDALTYRVPDGMPTPPIGARVRVPIGTRVVTGCVVTPAEPPGPGEPMGDPFADAGTPDGGMPDAGMP